MTIYKFPLPKNFCSPFSLALPSNARVIKAGRSHEEAPICMWVELDPVAKQEKTTFAVMATGEEFDDSWKHCYTFFEGMFVWHLYQQVTL